MVVVFYGKDEDIKRIWCDHDDVRKNPTVVRTWTNRGYEKI